MHELEPYQMCASCGTLAIGPPRKKDGKRKSGSLLCTKISGNHSDYIRLNDLHISLRAKMLIGKAGQGVHVGEAPDMWQN